MSWVPPFAIYTMKIPYVLGIHNVGRTVCDTIVNVIASMYRYARDVKASSHGNEKRNENSPFETLVRRTSGKSSQRKSVYIRHLIAFDLKNPQRATIRFVKVNIVNIIRSDNTKPVLAQWNFLSDSIHIVLAFWANRMNDQLFRSVSSYCSWSLESMEFFHFLSNIFNDQQNP